MTGYVGRFAPSPTGPLHAGSLVAALASWLDARAHGGRWLVRIEDVDRPRCIDGMGELILGQLAACGLQPDAPPWWQHDRDAAYAEALQQLLAAGAAYPCACTRQDVERALATLGRPRQRFGELVYPGTCRPANGGLRGRSGGGGTTLNTKIVNVIDPAEIVTAALATTPGQQVFMNFIAANARSINATLGK